VVFGDAVVEVRDLAGGCIDAGGDSGDGWIGDGLGGGGGGDQVGGGAGDPVADPGDDVAERHVLGGGDGVGPRGDVGEGVAAGVDAVVGEDEVRDRFGLDLSDPRAAQRVEPSGVDLDHTRVCRDLVGVEEDVAEFVGEGFGGLGGADVVAYPDFAFDDLGDAVGAVQISEGAAEEPVAPFADLGS
jgi:hypothetical protein